MVKRTGIAGGMFCIVFGLFLIISGVFATYKWNRDVESWWKLADKSSTLEAKNKYMQKFIEALEKQNLSRHDAIFLKTSDNDLQENLEAVKTLGKRLEQIKEMSPNSFEYNQAIQQITAQEQGEASKLINTLFWGWLLHNGYWYIWDWILIIFILGIISGLVVSFMLVMN